MILWFEKFRDAMAWIDNDMKLIVGSGRIDEGQGCISLPPFEHGATKPMLVNLTQSPTESVNLTVSAV